ncbi:unnamed protein product [marine sediment metagenome]|uniref:Uncharacterized protein n=1 Tax=marine sediment metagenome TaxID=412755 RepID=X1EI59_9ZZZZ
MTAQEKQLYEFALKVGDRRFGSACAHTIIKNGVCVRCLRRVWHR